MFDALISATITEASAGQATEKCWRLSVDMKLLRSKVLWDCWPFIEYLSMPLRAQARWWINPTAHWITVRSVGWCVGRSIDWSILVGTQPQGAYHWRNINAIHSSEMLVIRSRWIVSVLQGLRRSGNTGVNKTFGINLRKGRESEGMVWVSGRIDLQNGW